MFVPAAQSFEMSMPKDMTPMLLTLHIRVYLENKQGKSSKSYRYLTVPRDETERRLGTL